MSRFASPGLVLGAGTLLAQALGFLFWIALARGLTAVDVGVVSTAMSSMSLASLIVAAGAPAAISVMTLRHGSTRYGFTYGAAGGAAAAVLAAIFALFGGLDLQIAIWSALCAGALAASMYLDGLFIATERPFVVTFRNAGAVIGRFILASVAVAVGAADPHLILGVVAVTLWVAVAYQVAVRPKAPSVTSDRAAGHYLVHHGVTLSLLGPFLLAPVLVSAKFGSATAGEFYVPWMIVAAFATALIAASNAWLTQGFSGDGEVVSRRRMWLTFAGGAGIAAAVSATAYPLISLLSPMSAGFSAVLAVGVWVVLPIIALSLGFVRLRLEGRFTATVWCAAILGVSAAIVQALAFNPLLVAIGTVAVFTVAAVVVWIVGAKRSAPTRHEEYHLPAG